MEAVVDGRLESLLEKRCDDETQDFLRDTDKAGYTIRRSLRSTQRFSLALTIHLLEIAAMANSKKPVEHKWYIYTMNAGI
jgi:hypothetical protein